MPEVPLEFPRAWLEFADPADPEALVRADLTWLTSSWACIFAVGCRGITAGQPDDGCCTHGAFYTDRADERRVRAAATELTPQTWQRHREGRRGISTVDEGKRRTRVVDGACVFFNRPGFPGGYGCALHHLALRTGRRLLDTKPEVCWQVPLRRSYDTRERPDGTTVTVTTIGEFDRRAWGPGGHELGWWCTGATEAHRGATPLYLSYAEELTELLGAPAYAELARHCAAHLAGRPALRHLADPPS